MKKETTTPDEITAKALLLAPTGDLMKKGISGRDYFFKFGWLSRLYLEEKYGKGLERFMQETDNADLIANILLSGMRTKPQNNLPAEFSRIELFTLLDDLKESDIDDVLLVAKHSMGFINRLLGINPADVEELANAALAQSVTAPAPDQSV
jgi:hypothetical protein